MGFIKNNFTYINTIRSRIHLHTVCLHKNIRISLHLSNSWVRYYLGGNTIENYHVQKRKMYASKGSFLTSICVSK